MKVTKSYYSSVILLDRIQGSLTDMESGCGVYQQSNLTLRETSVCSAFKIFVVSNKDDRRQIYDKLFTTKNYRK